LAASRPKAAIESWGTEAIVAKPEWGMKRVCPSCGSRYYDMQRDPVTCPKCGAAYDPETVTKSRRARPAPVAEEPIEPMADEEIEAEVVGEEADETGEAVPAEGGEEGEEEEEEEVIEDASELGEDEDDMAEVIENVEDEEER
jgi:uncharacterized protein (TIGR02300 family)